MAFQALFSCQVQACAEETSFHADMLGIWEGDPICEACYSDIWQEKMPSWGELHDITLGDIRL